MACRVRMCCTMIPADIADRTTLYLFLPLLSATSLCNTVQGDLRPPLAECLTQASVAKKVGRSLVGPHVFELIKRAKRALLIVRFLCVVLINVLINPLIN